MILSEASEAKLNLLCSNGHSDKANDVDAAKLPTVSPDFMRASKKPENAVLNFSEGFFSTFLDKIIQHEDPHDARECILKRKNEGRSVKERTTKMSRDQQRPTW